MELRAKVNKWEFIDQYINIWNGGLQLTDKEREFFREIIFEHLSLEEQGVKEPFIGQLIFSKAILDKIKKKLNLSSQGLHNYKAQLINKKAIKQHGDFYHVNPLLVPKREITFKFEVYDV